MPIKQYVFLRGDLQGFKKGSLIAQACHAVTYATFTYLSHPKTQEYLEHITDMHKVILRITESDIHELSNALRSENIEFVQWVERPENIITCLATRPMTLEDHPDLVTFFYKYKLF